MLGWLRHSTSILITAAYNQTAIFLCYNDYMNVYIIQVLKYPVPVFFIYAAVNKLLVEYLSQSKTVNSCLSCCTFVFCQIYLEAAGYWRLHQPFLPPVQRNGPGQNDTGQS